MCSISLWIDNNSQVYALGDIAWTRGRIFTKIFIEFYEFTKVCNFDNFSLIWSKTRRCTPSICAISVYGWIITLQCILWEMEPGHGVEYFLSFHQFSKSCHFHIFSSNRTKHDVAHLPLMFYPYVKFKKKSIEYLWWYSLDMKPARRTDGKAETYIPSFHRG